MDNDKVFGLEQKVRRLEHQQRQFVNELRELRSSPAGRIASSYRTWLERGRNSRSRWFYLFDNLTARFLNRVSPPPPPPNRDGTVLTKRFETIASSPEQWGAVFAKLDSYRVSSDDERPRISILTPAWNTQVHWFCEAAISVLDQTCADWEWILVDDASPNPAYKPYAEALARVCPRFRLVTLPTNEGISGATNAALKMARAPYVCMLDHDDLLHPEALEACLEKLEEEDLDAVYTDSDKVSEKGFRDEPFYKPAWSPEYFRGVMFIGHLLCVRREIALKIGGFDKRFDGIQDFEFFLRFSEAQRDRPGDPPPAQEQSTPSPFCAIATEAQRDRRGDPPVTQEQSTPSPFCATLLEAQRDRPGHPQSRETTRIGQVPRILYHWRRAEGSIASATNAKDNIGPLQQLAVNEQLRRLGMNAEAKPGTFAHRVAVTPLLRKGSQQPRVSIVIPTRDTPEVLTKCLDSIRDKTTYKNYQIVCADNETTETHALRRMREPGIDRVVCVGSFNYSRINNDAIRKAADGEYLLLLNNDVEVITPNWIEEMLYYAEQQDVGAVGSLLLYPNGTVQHAGVALGFRGTADHLVRGFDPASDGYAGSLSCAREVSAVTAACLLVKRALYEEVGGLNEHYRTAYQDVDFCLRLLFHKKKRNIFTPRARLYHHESYSRKSFYDLIDRGLLLDCWDDYIPRDPFLNPNFSRMHVDYQIAHDADRGETPKVQELYV